MGPRAALPGDPPVNSVRKFQDMNHFMCAITNDWFYKILNINQLQEVVSIRRVTTIPTIGKREYYILDSYKYGYKLCDRKQEMHDLNIGHTTLVYDKKLQK